MLFRRLALSLVLVATALGTSACSLSDNVASLQPYAPSDGQQLTLESVKARNFIYLVSDSGAGYLIGSLVNSSPNDGIVKIQYENRETKEKSEYFFEIASGQKLDFGYNGNPALSVPVIERPGQTAQFYILESDTVSGGLRVPVLDGTLAEYRMLLEQLESGN